MLMRFKAGYRRKARPLSAVALCTLLAACVTAAEPQPQVQAPPAVSPEVVAIAEQAIEQGRPGDAKLLLERVLLAEPGNLRAHLAMAELQLAFRNLEAAEKGFAALAALPETASRAQQGRGIALLLQGRDQEARQALQKAIDEDPSLWRAWNAMASLDDRAGAGEDARFAYDRALALKPDSAVLYNNRGFSHLLRRDAEAAIVDFGMALKLDPKLEAARENLRLAFAWAGRYEQALLGVGKRDIGQAYNNIGFIALLRGDLPAAESYLLRSMEADPKFNRVANRNLEYLRGLKTLNAKKTEDAG